MSLSIHSEFSFFPPISTFAVGRTRNRGDAAKSRVAVVASIGVMRLSPITCWVSPRKHPTAVCVPKHTRVAYEQSNLSVKGH